MSILLQAHSLTYSVGRRLLFSGLDLAIGSGDRLGLVGHNGSGKSTLLAMLAGKQSADSGHITRTRSLCLATVEQFLPEELRSATLREAVALKVPADEAWRADAQLGRLGFSPAQLDQSLASLSGGQLNRLMLARALVQEPQLLLLDEPTNHLDLATLALFETILSEFRGALVIVSHDRTFLDQLCPATLIMRDQRIYRFELGYSRARRELARMDAAASARRTAEEKKIAKVRASAQRMAQWGKVYDNEDLARRAKSMFKRVGRMEEERTFVSRGSPLELGLAVAGSKGKRMLTLENLNVNVADRTLFSVDECFLRPGERIALLGHNGVGKTTLIKLILEQVQESDQTETHSLVPNDSVRVSPQARLGYYDQELNAVASNESLFEFVGRDIKRDDQGVVSALVSAGFEFEAHNTPVQSMSGGERARALFARLSLLRPNLLILDEPTNHIDIEGREQLESQLLESDAAVLFTSHDRQFVRTIAQRFWIIEDGRLREHVTAEDFFARAALGFERQNRWLADSGVGSSPPDPERGPERDPERDPESDDESDSEYALLERIDQLETLLAEDRARKEKFQKPKLQEQWRDELDMLNAQLDAL